MVDATWADYLSEMPESGRGKRSQDRVIDFTEQLSLTNQALMRVKGALDLSHTEVALLNKGISGFAKSFAESSKVNKQLLSINMNMSDVLRSTNSSLRGLPTSIHESIQTQFEFLEGGLLGVSQNSLMLASVMKISGGDIKNLINLNRDQIAIGRVTSHEANALNTTLAQVNLDSKISMNRLVGSLNSLSRRLSTLGGLGMTAEVQDAQLKMIERLGAGSDKLVNSLFDKMFDPNLSMGGEARLTVFDQLQSLRSPGGMTQDNLDKFLSTAGGTFNSMTEMANQMPFQIREGFLQNFGGDEGLGGIAAQLLAFREQMSEIDVNLGDSTSKFRENLDVFKNTILKPIQIALQGVAGGLLRIMGWAPRVFTGVATTLAVSLIWSRFTVTTRKLNTAALWANTVALRGGDAAKGIGLLASIGGPIGIGVALAAGIGMALLIPKVDHINTSLESIDAKTPDPDKATSLFADRSSTIIKQAIASTIFGGNELLAALNSGQLELAGSMLRVGDILLEEREDKGIPGGAF